MQSEQQWSSWSGQVISTSLYAWAVLTAGSAASASVGFRSMAQVLFKQASKKGPLAFAVPGVEQLFLAHQVTMHKGLGDGLSANEKLLERASAAYDT